MLNEENKQNKYNLRKQIWWREASEKKMVTDMRAEAITDAGGEKNNEISFFRICSLMKTEREEKYEAFISPTQIIVRGKIDTDR